MPFLPFILSIAGFLKILPAQPSETSFNRSLWLERIKRHNSDKKYFFDVFFIFLKVEKNIAKVK